MGFRLHQIPHSNHWIFLFNYNGLDSTPTENNSEDVGRTLGTFLSVCFVFVFNCIPLCVCTVKAEEALGCFVFKAPLRLNIRISSLLQCGGQMEGDPSDPSFPLFRPLNNRLP